MKLKTMALIACCLSMPGLASAQDPMSMSKKDSMEMSMSHKDSMSHKGMKSGKMGKMHKKGEMKMDEKSEMSMEERGDRGVRSRGARRSARGMERNRSAVTGDCVRGCPTSRGVAGLTGVQFLALQQELRDRGCGNNHVTGWLDAPTRMAIRECAKRMSVANNAAAVLTALNIGYTVGS